MLLDAKLAAGEVILLDGGTGMELERLDVPMDGVAWCALANKTHPETVREIHESYIRAGADLITANTYATSRNVLGPVGLGDEVAAINQRAVALAMEARDNVAAGRPVAVAASMSIMMPFSTENKGERDPDLVPPPGEMAANFREQAELLAAAGVDLILMEMMYDLDEARAATAAALGTGLPVWVGFSAGRRADGAVVAFRHEEVPFAELVDGVLALGGDVAGVMHTSVDDTDPALDILVERWDGPVMVYPESLVLKPVAAGGSRWDFERNIGPDEFAALSRGWVERGVQIVGGCCGITVDHIARMAEVVPRKLG